MAPLIIGRLKKRTLDLFTEFFNTIGYERHGRLLVAITILKNSAILDPSNVSHSPSILVASWLATSAPTSNYRLHSAEKEAHFEAAQVEYLTNTVIYYDTN